MIKTFENFNKHIDVDPYGEENWDEPEIFHVGDKVICIDDSGIANIKIKLDGIYEISDTLTAHIQLKGQTGFWMKRRFKLLKNE